MFVFDRRLPMPRGHPRVKWRRDIRRRPQNIFIRFWRCARLVAFNINLHEKNNPGLGRHPFRRGQRPERDDHR